MLRGRLTVIGALAVASFAAGVALASCGGDEEEGSQTTTMPTVTAQPTETTDTETTTEVEDAPIVVRLAVLGGAPQGGIVRETVRKGDRVVLQVRSDEADEVHLHGYDLSTDVAPGAAARIAFVADVPGRFEVELEESGVQIAELTVRP